MRGGIIAILAAAGLTLGGCAHTPAVTLSYYLPKTSVSFKVIRTVACDAGDNLNNVGNLQH